MTIGSDYQVIFDMLLQDIPKETPFDIPSVTQYLDRDKIPEENFFAYTGTDTFANGYRFYNDMFQYLHEEGFVTPADNGKYQLTAEGKKVKECSSFREWERQRLKQLFKEDLEFRKLEQEVDGYKWTKYRAWAALIISSILLILELRKVLK